MKQLTIYILAGLLLMTQYACNKQLSKLPENAKVDGNAIVDEKTAQVGLNGAYYRLANISASSNVTLWTTHQVAPGMFAGYLGYGAGAIQDESNNNVSSSFGSQFWGECYNTLNAANSVIGAVQALPDNMFAPNRKNQILGESRFLRAYNHFRLLIYYGEWYKPGSVYGVLLRDELSTLSNIQKHRSTVADSYQFILDDLDYAITNAPDSNAAWYATKWAAMALKMRVLLSRGQQTDYTTAIDLGTAIMQSPRYALEANVKDIFYTKGLSSKEVILGIKPQLNQEAYYYILSRAYYPGQSSFYVAKSPLKDLLQGDPRSTWVIGGANTKPQSPNTFFFSKYIAQGGATTQVSETSYMLRLSEVYLLQAEAIIRSGGNLNTAKGLIKTVMGHAGVTDFSAIDNAATPDELLLQNYYEIVRSLVGEDGAEWMALLRLPFDKVKQLKPTITDQIQYTFPIPVAEFQANPAIGDQNPGYSK